MEQMRHHPAMAEVVLDCLQVKSDGVYVDATVGLGGHSELILQRLGPDGRLICIDRDEVALSMAKERLDDDRCSYYHSRFSLMGDVLANSGGVDGILLDFGVSMMQLKDLGRGFSFDSDEVLDMRMDKTDDISAQDIVNKWQEKELANAIYAYGQEGRSRKIASHIVTQRKMGRISTCRQLADIVSRAVGGRKGRTHPATRTFQALRMVVNQEIEQIQLGLAAALESLKAGGRLVAISYHSLEDREVKMFIREAGKEGVVNVITKKPLVPTRDEQREHPSVRSAKLRCAEAR